MVPKVGQRVRVDYDDVDIVQVNLSGDWVAEENRNNNEVQNVPLWQQCRSKSFEEVSKD